MINTLTRIAGAPGVLRHSSTGMILVEISSLDELVDLGGAMILGVAGNGTTEDSWAWSAGAEMLDKLYASTTASDFAWSVMTQYSSLASLLRKTPGRPLRVSFLETLGARRPHPDFMFPGYTTSHRIFGIKTGIFSGSGAKTNMETLSIGRAGRIGTDGLAVTGTTSIGAFERMPTCVIGGAILRVPQGRTWLQAIDTACNAMFNKTDEKFKAKLAPAMPHIKRRMVEYMGAREDLNKDMSAYMSCAVTRDGLRVVPSSGEDVLSSVAGSPIGHRVYSTIARSPIDGRRVTIPPVICSSSEADAGLITSQPTKPTEAQIEAFILSLPLIGSLDALPVSAISGGLVGSDFSLVDGAPVDRSTYSALTCASIWTGYRGTVVVGGVSPSEARPMVKGVPVTTEVWAAGLQAERDSKTDAGLNQITSGSWEVNNRSLGFFTATMAAACNPKKAKNWEMWDHDCSMASFASDIVDASVTKNVPSMLVFPGDSDGDVSDIR